MQPATFSRTRRRATVCALLAVLALLALPAPAWAESECIADAPGDVVDLSTGEQVSFPEADILAACTNHTADQLEISVRVAVPTDPSTDPAWADFATSIGAAIDTDGDSEEEFDVNYGRFPDGQVRVAVFEHVGPNEASNQLCTGTGIYDGTRYQMLIPTACIGNPAQVSTAAFMYNESTTVEQEELGRYDEVPADPALQGPFTAAADPATAVQRLAGDSRVATALAVSADDFADGAAAAVVLALADRFPDALVAAPLAVATDAPVLLTSGSELIGVVAGEIQRVLPSGGTVYLSGGPAALSEDVRTQVEALGYVVQRVAGDTRYATSVAIADTAVPDPQVIVVADGNGFPDALVGGSLAGFEGGVEILSDGPQLSAEGAAYLAAHPAAEVLAVGPVAAQAVPSATPLAGADAFATSVAVAARYGEVQGVAIASGTNFPDGLAGGAHAARRGFPLLLSWPDVLPSSVAEYLTAAAPLGEVIAYGGTAALSHQIAADAESAVN